MRPQLRIVFAIAMVFAIYAAWAGAVAHLVTYIFGYDCVQSFLSVRCALPQDVAAITPAYALLGLFLLGFALLLRGPWKHSAPYPFLMLSLVLCALALLWDLVSVRPILSGAKIVNDTINVLGAVIAASFTLLIIICRRQAFSLGRLALATVTSYGLTIVSIAAFIALSSSIFGVTELFLLYVIYAFGSFTLHLMTVCRFVAALPETAALELAR